MKSIECIVFYCNDQRVIDFHDGIDHGPTAKVMGARNFWEAQTRPISQEEVLRKAPVEGAEGFYHIFLVMN